MAYYKNMDEIKYNYDIKKNIILKETRGVSFEDIITLIEANRVLDIIEHQNLSQYPDQKFFVIDIENDIYFVPFIKNGNMIFLKTIFASRKGTKMYLAETGGAL